MAEFKFAELKSKKVADLREIAKGLEGDPVQGYTQLRKDELLRAICKAVGIDPHVHHRAMGIDKGAIKQQIHELKARRDDALKSKDQAQLKRVRRKIHKLKHQLRAAAI